MINNILEKLKQKNDLNNNDLENIYKVFKAKSINEDEIKELLLSWREKGETSSEIAFLADLINLEQKQSSKYIDAIDICGTGGDRLNTFNISTLTAITVSSLGIKVIKHSGRSSTSISGSVDILNEFGIDLDMDEKRKENSFEKTNLMFVSSKDLREVFGKVKLVSKTLGVAGFVNLLGPLTNPYKTSHHLLGVSNIKWGDLLSLILKQNNNQKKQSIIACSKISENEILDELSFCGTNHIWEIKPENELVEREITPEEFGYIKTNIEHLKISNKTENKLIFEIVLKGKFSNIKENECIRATALNTGGALYLVNKASSIKSGYDIALKHIQSGICWEHFQDFINSSN